MTNFLYKQLIIFERKTKKAITSSSKPEIVSIQNVVQVNYSKKSDNTNA